MHYSMNEKHSYDTLLITHHLIWTKIMYLFLLRFQTLTSIDTSSNTL